MAATLSAKKPSSKAFYRFSLRFQYEWTKRGYNFNPFLETRFIETDKRTKTEKGFVLLERNPIYVHDFIKEVAQNPYFKDKSYLA